MKSTNQFYNKRKADLQQQLGHTGTTKRTNQNFVQIPHARFIAMLTYKAELVGMRVEITEESYTSKASLLDLDPLPVGNDSDETKHTFSGKRLRKRYKSRASALLFGTIVIKYTTYTLTNGMLIAVTVTRHLK